MQRYLAKQFHPALSEGIVRKQPDRDDIAHPVILERLLESREQQSRALQVSDRRPGGIADNHTLAAGQGIHHGDDLVPGDLLIVFHELISVRVVSGLWQSDPGSRSIIRELAWVD